MIEDRMIDDKIMLSDLLAQAVAMGIRAGRNQIEHKSVWYVAHDILNETEEVLRHRESLFELQATVIELNNLMRFKENE